MNEEETWHNPLTQGIFEFWHAAVRQGTLHHAYVLVGQDQTAARGLMRALLRELHIDVNETFTSHPDVVALGSTEETISAQDKQSRTSISIDEIRLLKNRFSGHATTAQGWRVLIIERAHNLTHEAANALLKLLEEPGARMVFLLCARAKELLLPTLRSRCHFLYVSGDAASESAPYGVDEIKEQCRALVAGTDVSRWALMETLFKKENKQSAHDVETRLNGWERMLREEWRLARQNRVPHAERMRVYLEKIQIIREHLAHHVNPRLLFEQLIIHS